MPRPRKDTSEVLFDLFSDLSVDAQTLALMVLNAIHRQRRRMRPNMTTTPAEMQEAVHANLREIRAASEGTPEDELEERLQASLDQVKGRGA